MDEIEFIALAQRIRMAFEIPSTVELQIEIANEDEVAIPPEICCMMTANGEDFSLEFFLYSAPNDPSSPDTWNFSLFERNRDLPGLYYYPNKFSCLELPDNPETEIEFYGDPWCTQAAYLMVRGLHRLGFDTTFIEADRHLGVTPEYRANWLLDVEA